MSEENPYAASQTHEPVAVWKERAAVTNTRMVLGWITYLVGSVVCLVVASVIAGILGSVWLQFSRSARLYVPVFELLGFPLFIMLNYVAYWFSVKQVILPSVTQRSRKLARIERPELP